jgi:hypothetical protein
MPGRGAVAALRNALFHAAHSLAAFSAILADLRAGCAGLPVVVGSNLASCSSGCHVRQLCDHPGPSKPAPTNSEADIRRIKVIVRHGMSYRTPSAAAVLRADLPIVRQYLPPRAKRFPCELRDPASTRSGYRCRVGKLPFRLEHCYDLTNWPRGASGEQHAAAELTPHRPPNTRVPKPRKPMPVPLRRQRIIRGITSTTSGHAVITTCVMINGM